MRYLIFFIFAIAFLSCKNSSETPVADSTAPNGEEMTAAAPSYNIQDLTKYVGQMPSESGIFKVANLAERTKDIMGQHFIDFENGWFDKLPVEQYEDYIYFGGCQFANCDGIKYFIIVDLTEDNINVLHYGGKRPYSFEEGAIIGMPDRISDAFEAFRK
jgi:hypothetical protein